MYDECWSSTLIVELPESQGVETIRTTREAADCLMDKWRAGARGSEWDDALRICLDVYERMATPAEAQAAFIHATLAAGYRYQEQALSE